MNKAELERIDKGADGDWYCFSAVEDTRQAIVDLCAEVRRWQRLTAVLLKHSDCDRRLASRCHAELAEWEGVNDDADY